MSDLIDREAALNCFHDWVDKYGDVHTPDEMPEYRAIEGLPSAQPERKRGKWEMLQMPISPPVYKCSVCGSHALQSVTGCLMNRHYEANLTNFCPHCGAKMEVDDGSD